MYWGPFSIVYAHESCRSVSLCVCSGVIVLFFQPLSDSKMPCVNNASPPPQKEQLFGAREVIIQTQASLHINCRLPPLISDLISVIIYAPFLLRFQAWNLHEFLYSRTISLEKQDIYSNFVIMRFQKEEMIWFDLYCW